MRKQRKQLGRMNVRDHAVAALLLHTSLLLNYGVGAMNKSN